MPEGTLKVTPKKVVTVTYINNNGKEMTSAVAHGVLSRSLADLANKTLTLGQLNGMKVEVEIAKGLPSKITKPGELWESSAPAVGNPQGSLQPHGESKGGASNPQSGRPEPQILRQGDFHNPYNFVPALPREEVTGELADRGPTGHDRYHDGYYSGVIQVRMTLKTPLLLPDAASATTDQHGHKKFLVRRGPDQRPYVPPTSVKGMLRSAYEAVTNSRLAVFQGHEDRLAYRMPARDGLSLVPARIENGMVTLLMGTTPGLPWWDRQSRRWRVPDDLLYAAWLPRYDNRHGGIASWAVKYPNRCLPQHQDHVRAIIELIERGPFLYWKVRQIVPADQQLGPDPVRSEPRGIHIPVFDQRLLHVEGYVCITNENIKNKHDERVFFVFGQPAVQRPLTVELREAWNELIRNYQRTHEKDLVKRAEAGQSSDAYLGGEPGRTAWSRHVYKSEALQLTNNSLCYAYVRETEADPFEIVALYPVMISRKLFQTSPGDLLPGSLYPATSIGDLSPADRVFGWVNQEGPGAYRGNLRIGPVHCQRADAVFSLGDDGLPLAILGEPKPQQAGFYVAKSDHGEGQENSLDKETAGYSDSKGLRGRKVYPHHAVPDSYWDEPLQDRTQQNDHGHFQEYRRPHQGVKETIMVRGRPKDRVCMNADGTYVLDPTAEQRDDQNRSILEWVKENTTFDFEIHVSNLSPVELGALLWLLSLDDGHFHRLGGGKPLGFGSVRLEIDSLDLRSGEAWGAWYANLDAKTLTTGKYLQNKHDAAHIVKAYTQEVEASYGKKAPFPEVSFISAFLQAAKGFGDLPIHYPRARQQGTVGPVPPHPEGLAYEWFVANDRGPHVTLRDLPNDPGLPLLSNE